MRREHSLATLRVRVVFPQLCVKSLFVPIIKSSWNRFIYAPHRHDLWQPISVIELHMARWGSHGMGWTYLAPHLQSVSLLQHANWTAPSFSEIIPQSVCTRHGLAIGAHMAWFVRLLFFTVVSWFLFNTGFPWI